MVSNSNLAESFTHFDPLTNFIHFAFQVGIQSIMNTMNDKCKCHGVSGSCSMKTCWRKLSDFNTTAAMLRVKYHQAIRKLPTTKASRRDILGPIIKQRLVRKDKLN
jgi:wingless-type MMTV integration site family, member 9